MADNINHRRFLKMAVAGAGLLLAGFSAWCSLFKSSDARTQANSDFTLDVEIALKAAGSEVPILPGSATRVWSFQAELLKGKPGATTAGPGLPLLS